MNKIVSALILALGLGLSFNAYADCPTPVKSEVFTEGKGTGGANLYNLDGSAFSITYTNIPWRMTHSQMFLSGLMGKNWYMVEHEPDMIILGSYTDKNVFMTVSNGNGFLLIRTGDAKSFDKAAEIVKADNTCFRHFIQVD